MNARAAQAGRFFSSTVLVDSSLPRHLEMMHEPLPPTLFFNRELSWLEFNARVLHEAFDERNPLLERLKFLSIFSTNLDEFYMVRVAGLRRQVAAGVTSSPADGLSPQAAARRDRAPGARAARTGARVSARATAAGAR